jgi:predicted CoA-binding protein/ribosomal protein S18 acetylase RimI-like enzyme
MAGAAADQMREADVVLRDGTTMRVRPACQDDAPALRRLFERLSDESRYLRFFSGAVDVPLVVHWAADVDPPRRDGLVAVTGPGDCIVAHAGWERERDHPECAEVALVIDDEFQGRGLGTILLGQLAEGARGRGIELFVAEVLPNNYRMIQVFRDSGFAARVRSMPGLLLVEIPTTLTPDALRRFDEREEQAAAAALRKVLAPRSAAVVGASRRRGTVGGELFHNLLAAGFTGPVYPVNPKAAAVQSVAAYPSVDDLPSPVDLAVLAVPVMQVVPVARACGARGVGALVVLSAGFAESGPEGAQRQRELLEICRQAGMRLIGPNCLGVINTDPAVRLDATFGPTLPVHGRVGFGSQSGALGLAIVDVGRLARHAVRPGWGHNTTWVLESLGSAAWGLHAGEQRRLREVGPNGVRSHGARPLVVVPGLGSSTSSARSGPSRRFTIASAIPTAPAARSSNTRRPHPPRDTGDPRDSPRDGDGHRCVDAPGTHRRQPASAVDARRTRSTGHR